LTQSTTGGPPPNTLPAERTVLAWTRTSFAFLANGALLTVKDLHGARGLAALILAGLAGLAALCTYLIGLQRQRTLQRRPIPTHITPRRQVHIVAMATLLLIVMTMVAQLV
jgi:uncharacterized membrane protein YidH (DUF202 family)